jgi:GNAT superfamily N-acetyltransferase
MCRGRKGPRGGAPGRRRPLGWPAADPIEEGAGSVTHDSAGELEIGDLDRRDVREAVAVLARGMRDNPVHVAAFGDDAERRRRTLERLFGALFRVMTDQRPICARRDGRIVAAAGIAPAGTCQPTGRQRLALAPALLATGPGSAVRALRWTGAWAARDPDEPHAHLGPLAVDADLQGQGIGSLLLAEYCRRLDAAAEIGYLETDRAENVPFYARQGFETVGEAEVLGVPNWFMRRRPRRGLGARAAARSGTAAGAGAPPPALGVPTAGRR